MSSGKDRGRVLGLGLAALAALFASSAGLLVRHIEQADGWQVLFYRSLSFTALVLLFVLISHRGRSFQAFRSEGPGSWSPFPWVSPFSPSSSRS